MKHGSLAAALAVAVLGHAAAADGRVPGDAIGCQALEQAVYAGVLQSSERGTAVRLRQDLAHAGHLECADTARAVTAAFTRAMARGNIYLTWQWDRNRGDMCLSGDLSQCYPRGNPFVPLPRADAAFVADSWFAVLLAVGKSMPQGYFADVSRFTSVGMAMALGAELERRTGGRLRQAYSSR
ncbi:MAG TPA: hypothetical protein VFY03_14500 [Woeseiaceae bacterium]|nr:hypothetical protein [Woeseiaceae bacterium]